MKRTYIKPEVFLLDEEIETSIMVISASTYEGSEKDQGTTGTGGDTSSGGGGGGPGAREGSLFEDDDYDF